MTDDVFTTLRQQVLAGLPERARFADQAELVPIEGTVDGWYCLHRDGRVVHVDNSGASVEPVTSAELATALIGRLLLRFPIASRFLPHVAEARVCPDCNGTGTVANLPEALRRAVVCRCGGLGWRPV